MNTIMKENLSEKDKMLSNMYYEHLDENLTADRKGAADLLYLFNTTKPSQEDTREKILTTLLGHMGRECEIKQPFRCDYGYNLKLGDRVFINYGCTILDCNEVTIGDDTLLAPGVQISTAYHPIDPRLRLDKKESASSIHIGSNVWIGAGAIICPNVKIGNNTTIGAGSIVTRNIPSNVVAVGNPCKVVKHID